MELALKRCIIGDLTIGLWKQFMIVIWSFLELNYLLFSNSMVREAKAGNVQAARLVLEHSGKLVKNVNVTIDSPFEKWLKKVDDAEVVDGEVVEEQATTLVQEIEFNQSLYPKKD